MKRPAIFFDRDGVIVVESNFQFRADKIELYADVIDALTSVKSNYLKVVVSNQSGISKGYFTAEDVKNFNRSLSLELRGHDINIDGWYFCPHGPDDNCTCRKPKSGMILNAAQDLGINLSASWMIGDKSTDVEAGSAAGLKTILLKTGYAGRESGAIKAVPDHIADNLYDAIVHINGSKS